MFDTSYTYPPSSGWMFLPLIPYHEGPPDSIFVPLSKNIADYDWALGMYFLYAVAAEIRGYELYDNEDTKQVVIKWTTIFKNHRDILISDIIHVRRPDNQFVDCIMHVNPFLSEKGFIAVFNPLTTTVNTTLQISLYYTGLSGKAYLSHEDQAYVPVTLTQLYNLALDVYMEPQSITYYVLSDSPN
ncbi:hypothetical protein RFI_15538 [Reticulomyxa filosa]|uniref:Uncharacterized protein n=1 Tax=Reticulomyxa filosa TaxID=46433 RepID=X6N6I5_RETFI|nr:hypothetical protein RFI_15538 [Reticulomyxa filosa]|eukprot:ETO21666.1 hypothetical protein RFI_15538 [Reticulomyxa filosa]